METRRKLTFTACPEHLAEAIDVVGDRTCQILHLPADKIRGDVWCIEGHAPATYLFYTFES